CLIGERWINLRPLDLEFLGCLNRTPFLVGNDAEKALVPHNLGARNILDRALVDLHRHRAGDWWPDHPSMDHPRHFHVGAEILLSENLRCNIFTLDRQTDNLVLFRALWLCLAWCIKGIAVLLVPVELNVEIFAADQLP